MSWAELCEDLLAKNVVVKLFMLHRFRNLFSLHVCCRISFFEKIQCYINKPVYLAGINKI